VDKIDKANGAHDKNSAYRDTVLVKYGYFTRARSKHLDWIKQL